VQVILIFDLERFLLWVGTLKLYLSASEMGDWSRRFFSNLQTLFPSE